MSYQRIVLERIPRIYFAHKYQTTAGSWLMVRDPLLCEITVIEKGDVRIVYANGEHKDYQAPCILPFMHDLPCKIITKATLHRHYTLAFYLSEKAEMVSAESVCKCLGSAYQHEEQSYISILPEYIAAGTVYDKIARNVKLVISDHQSIDVVDKLKSVRYVFQILSELSEYSLEKARASSTVNFINLYTTKAIKYISEHITEKIYVQEIADELKISYGYLSRVFREDMGITLVQYINQAKTKRVEELIMAKDITLEEAGQCVGITDVKYLSRIFKIHSGMTVSEYKKLL